MIQKPKGTYDVINNKKILYFESLVKNLMEVYNYEYFRTPIFESSELFHRGVGETSDIVTKETYDFKDRADRSMTLRPEGTAGVVRSYIENKLYGNHSVPVKAWYFGPMFRYERPQSGRFREFYQFGVEVLGSSDPMTDAEVISIPVTIYKLLGLKNVKVRINTLGDTESRNSYREALINYFKPYIGDLCEDCQKRYLKNPLRILDCKVDSNSECMKNVPNIIDYLNDYSKEYFENVKKYLEVLGIEYIVDTNIVRGLDYYSHTVFEVTAEIKDFGSQNVLCGGGRYDGLVRELDGPETPGIGFALGLERLLNALDAENIDLGIKDEIDLYMTYMSENEKDIALGLTMDLRLNGFKVELDYMNRNLKSNFKQADRLNSKFIGIVGEDEKKNKYLTVKNNKTKEEVKVKYEDLIYFLDENLQECNCSKEHDHCEGNCHCHEEE